MSQYGNYVPIPEVPRIRLLINVFYPYFIRGSYKLPIQGFFYFLDSLSSTFAIEMKVTEQIEEDHRSLN
jgi:hypothetical protein